MVRKLSSTAFARGRTVIWISSGGEIWKSKVFKTEFRGDFTNEVVSIVVAGV